ncbi:XH domain-containing protein [Pycnococcus provasolii]
MGKRNKRDDDSMDDQYYSDYDSDRDDAVVRDPTAPARMREDDQAKQEPKNDPCYYDDQPPVPTCTSSLAAAAQPRSRDPLFVSTNGYLTKPFPGEKNFEEKKKKWDAAVAGHLAKFRDPNSSFSAEKPLEKSRVAGEEKYVCKICRNAFFKDLASLYQHCDSKSRQGSPGEWLDLHAALAEHIAVDHLGAKVNDQRAVSLLTVAKTQRAQSLAENAAGTSRAQGFTLTKLNEIQGDEHVGEIAWPPTVVLEHIPRFINEQNKYVSKLGGNNDLRTALGIGEAVGKEEDHISCKLLYNFRGFTGVGAITFPPTYNGYTLAIKFCDDHMKRKYKQRIGYAHSMGYTQGMGHAQMAADVSYTARLLTGPDLHVESSFFLNNRLPMKESPFKSHTRMAHATLYVEHDRLMKKRAAEREKLNEEMQKKYANNIEVLNQVNSEYAERVSLVEKEKEKLLQQLKAEADRNQRELEKKMEKVKIEADRRIYEFKEKDHAEKQRMMALEDKAKSAEEMERQLDEQKASLERKLADKMEDCEQLSFTFNVMFTQNNEFNEKSADFLQLITKTEIEAFLDINSTLKKGRELPLRQVGEVQQTTVEKMLTCFKKKHPSLQDFEMAVAEKVQDINTTLRGANFCPLKVVSTNDEHGNEKNGYAIIYDDPELVSIKEEWDEDIMQDIAEERLRLEKINASGQYASWQVWDSVIDDKMNPFEVAQKLIGMLLDQKSIIDEQKSTIDELMPNQGSRRRRQR